MYEPTGKSKVNKRQAVANKIYQKKSAGMGSFHFVDNRPEAIIQEKMKEMTDKSPIAERSAQLQEKVYFNGDRVHGKALQTSTAPHTAPGRAVIQRWMTQEDVENWQVMGRLLDPVNQHKPIDFVAIGDAYKVFKTDVLQYLARREALVRTGFATDRIERLIRRFEMVQAVVAEKVAEEFPSLYDSLKIRMSGVNIDLREEIALASGNTEPPAPAGAPVPAPKPAARLTREAEDVPREIFQLDQEYKGLTVRNAAGLMLAELDGVNLLTSTIYEDKTADPNRVDENWIAEVRDDVITRKMDAIRTRSARVATRDARDRFRVPTIAHLRQMTTFVLRLNGKAGEYKRRFLFNLRDMLAKLGQKYPGVTFVLMTGSNVVDDMTSQPPETPEAGRIKSFEAP